MKTKLFNILMMILIVFSLTSCGKVEDDPDGSDIIIDDGNEGNTDKPIITPPVEGKVEFKVSLIYNKKVYKPESNEVINVIWADDFSQYSAPIDSDGYAKIKLDGNFRVYLENPPSGYSYNPNIYSANNDSPVVEIELLKISKISKGSGTALYKEYQMSSTGTYRATIKNAKNKVYYEYAPNKSGVYIVESLVNINDDLINPKLDVYSGTFAYKHFDETIDGGGASKSGGYTKNFRWAIYISDQMIGNVYTFGVYATTKTSVYPVDIDFSITYAGEHTQPDIVSVVMKAEEYQMAVIPFEESDPEKYIYRNSDGGYGSYYQSGTTNGTGIIDGSKFKYNEETKLWHVYDPVNNTFGPKLCVKITQPCCYYDPEGALNYIEYHGNKNLTVSNGTENYKQFVEVYYASVCNSDGVCYVTMEMKEFLQKFSVSQRLFFDGNGFVEGKGVYAIEEDQWLFACGYYVEK